MDSSEFELVWDTLRVNVLPVKTITPERLREVIAASEALAEEAKMLLIQMTGLPIPEILYLRAVAKMDYGHNNWMSEWGKTKAVRGRLEALGLVTLSFNRACGCGDVDSHSCRLTQKGRQWLEDHKE